MVENLPVVCKVLFSHLSSKTSPKNLHKSRNNKNDSSKDKSKSLRHWAKEYICESPSDDKPAMSHLICLLC